MKLVVLGAGAIGGFAGASISHAGAANVTLVARGAHFEAMRDKGVEVQSAQGGFTAHPAVTDDLDVLTEADVVLVGLKAHSLTEVAPRMGPLLRPGAATVWAQNGIPWWYFQSYPGPLCGTVLQSVDPGGIISGSIPAERNIGCVVYCAAEVVEPGVIRHIEGRRFALGEPDGSSTDRCRQISAIFQRGGLRAPVESNLRDHIWLKLVGNVAFNPITALTGATLGQLGTLPEMVDLLGDIFAECAAVAAKLGVSFPIPLEKRLEAALAVGEHKTSMLQDLEAGKPLELQCITGAVVELAQLLNVEVPRAQTVHACTKLLDQLSQRAPRPGQR